MMVVLLLYAYAVGEPSAQGIERRCFEDVAFRVIAANQAPDHATVACFRARHQDALADLFGEVLARCARAGAISVGVTAVDGTRMKTNAADRANLSYGQLARGILAEAEAVDGAEDAEFGERRKPRPIPATPQGRINMTGPDSRPVKTATRFSQGYTAQAVATPEQIVISADVICGANERHRLAPMITAACGELAAAGITQTPEIALADAGYWNSPHIDQLAETGIRSLVRPDADSRKQPTMIRSSRRYEQMRDLLKTDDGKQLYRRRQAIIEPVFAHTNITRRADRFQRRGLPACCAERRLITATHNLLKLWRRGLSPLPA